MTNFQDKVLPSPVQLLSCQCDFVRTQTNDNGQLYQMLLKDQVSLVSFIVSTHVELISDVILHPN